MILWLLFQNSFLGENDSSQKFRDTLQSEDIQRMIHDFMNTTTVMRNVDMNLDAVENNSYFNRKTLFENQNSKTATLQNIFEQKMVRQRMPL